MAEGIATRSSRGPRTICLPIAEEADSPAVNDPVEFRRRIEDRFQETPAWFPAHFAHGDQLKDDRMSAQQGLPIRRILVKDQTASSVRPSFLRPAMTGWVEDVEGPWFLRQFGVPFWARARVFGGDPRSWDRREGGLGRFRVVGTTVRPAELPAHLLADAPPPPRDGQPVAIAPTGGGGCCLGAEPAGTAGIDDRKADEGFKDEARDFAPESAPKTVSTDGGKGTQTAWKALFKRVILRQCFWPAWLKGRDRAKPWKDLFAEACRRVGKADHAPDRRRFGQRLRSLRGWATGHRTGIVLEKVLDLGDQRDRWSIASRHPGGPRTSHMRDRLRRGMNRSCDRGPHLHGSRAACRWHCRAWALLGNFTPWQPAMARENEDWRCPAERLNRHRYHDCWLQNLLISASLDGYRCPLPQNP